MLADPGKNVGRELRPGAARPGEIVDRAGKVRYVHRDPKSRDQPVYVGQLRRLLDECVPVPGARSTCPSPSA